MQVAVSLLVTRPKSLLPIFPFSVTGKPVKPSLLLRPSSSSSVIVGGTHTGSMMKPAWRQNKGLSGHETHGKRPEKQWEMGGTAAEKGSEREISRPKEPGLELLHPGDFVRLSLDREVRVDHADAACPVPSSSRSAS